MTKGSFRVPAPHRRRPGPLSQLGQARRRGPALSSAGVGRRRRARFRRLLSRPCRNPVAGRACFSSAPSLRARRERERGRRGEIYLAARSGPERVALRVQPSTPQTPLRFPSLLEALSLHNWSDYPGPAERPRPAASSRPGTTGPSEAGRASGRASPFPVRIPRPGKAACPIRAAGVGGGSKPPRLQAGPGGPGLAGTAAGWSRRPNRISLTGSLSISPLPHDGSGRRRGRSAGRPVRTD